MAIAQATGAQGTTEELPHEEVVARLPLTQTVIYFWRKDKEKKAEVSIHTKGSSSAACSPRTPPAPCSKGSMRRYVRLSNVTRHAMQAAVLSIPCSPRWRP